MSNQRLQSFSSTSKTKALSVTVTMKDIPVASESCSMPQATVTMDSWDDEDDHIGVMSPSVFRSPKVDYKDGESILIVSWSALIET